MFFVRQKDKTLKCAFKTERQNDKTLKYDLKTGSNQNLRQGI